jgi:hypothetical protein
MGYMDSAGLEELGASRPLSPYELQVVRAGEWALTHRAFLGAVFRAFDETADWPEAEALQRSMERAALDIDVGAAMSQMPTSLGHMAVQRIVLSLRGLSYVPKARPILDDYFALLKLAYERYVGDGDEPQVGRRDLSNLGVSEADVQKISRLIEADGWPFNGGGSENGDWFRRVGRDIRHLRGLENIDELLARQAELWYPGAPISQASAQKRARVSRRARLKRWLQRRWLWRLLATEERTIGQRILVLVVAALAGALLLAVAQRTYRLLNPHSPTFEERVADICDSADSKMAAAVGHSFQAAIRRSDISTSAMQALKALVPVSPPAQRVSFEDYVYDRFTTANLRLKIARAVQEGRPTHALSARLANAQYTAEADAQLAGLAVCGQRAPLE